jgi:hypothetical protein
MSHLMPSLLLGLLLIVCHSAAAEPATKEAATKDARAKEFKALIEQLASPNMKPMTHNDGDATVKFPPRYDVQAQARINEARKQLQRDVEEALPFLVEALNDARYSLTMDWADGDGYYNRSVGEVCEEVITSHLEIYRDKIRFSSPQHWRRYNGAPISKEWYEPRKDRSLAELQVEAVERALALRKADRGKSEPKEVREESNKEVSALEALRDQIVKSGKPVEPQRLLRMVTRDR